MFKKWVNVETGKRYFTHSGAIRAIKNQFNIILNFDEYELEENHFYIIVKWDGGWIRGQKTFHLRKEG